MCTKKQPDKSLRPRVYIVPAVTNTKLIGNAPNPHGREPPKEQSSLFPATLREGGASLREAASLAFPLTPIGRGGSVSRRDLHQAYWKRAQLAWARTSQRADKPIPSHSSGGSAREGLLLEKPPPSQTRYSSFLYCSNRTPASLKIAREKSSG